MSQGSQENIASIELIKKKAYDVSHQAILYCVFCILLEVEDWLRAILRQSIGEEAVNLLVEKTRAIGRLSEWV